MTVGRTVAAVVGLFAVAAGLTFAFRPGTAAGFRISEIVIPAVGTIVFLYAGVVLLGRARSERRTGEPPDPELLPDGPVPGDGFDDLVASAGGSSSVAIERRKRLHRRIERVALAAIRRHSDCTESEARELLDSGGWTDDPLAAAYFNDDPVPMSDVDLRQRVYVTLTGTEPDILAARRAAEEVATLSDAEGGST